MTTTIKRTGRPPLTFTGETISEQEGKLQNGKEQTRWHDLRLYRTQGGKYVLEVSYRTCWQGEGDHTEAEVVADAKDLTERLTGLDPCAHVQGYPPHPNYTDKQARLLADIRTRYEQRVGALLAEAGAEFAERVE